MEPLAAQGAKGFTLIEIAVVLAIVGVLALAGIAATRPTALGSAESEARRLAALLELAQIEARAGGQPMAWTPRAGGYTFLYRSGDGAWEEAGANTPFRARSLPRGIELRASQAVLGSRGLHAPVQAVLSADGAAYLIRSEAFGRLSVRRLHPD